MKDDVSNQGRREDANGGVAGGLHRPCPTTANLMYGDRSTDKRAGGGRICSVVKGCTRPIGAVGNARKWLIVRPLLASRMAGTRRALLTALEAGDGGWP